MCRWTAGGFHLGLSDESFGVEIGPAVRRFLLILNMGVGYDNECR